MTPRSFRVLALAPLLAALACSGPTLPVAGVAAQATADGIVATNATNRPVLYFAVEQGTLALITMAPCNDVAVCPTIPARGTITIPWADVPGYAPTRHVYLLFWSQPLPTLLQAPSSGRLEVVWP
jgi:hypothetical protein